MKTDNNTIRGWGISQDVGVTITDRPPLFPRANERAKWLHLLLDPERWIMFSAVEEYLQKYYKKKPVRVLVLGCGTGAQVVDLAHYFGKRVDLDGADPVLMQVQMAQKNMKKYQVNADIHCINEEKFPWRKGTFDIVYVHEMAVGVTKREEWFSQVSRVLKSTGVCIFSCSVKPPFWCVREKRIASLKEGGTPSVGYFSSMFSYAGFSIVQRFGRVFSWVTWFPESYVWITDLSNVSDSKIIKLYNMSRKRKAKQNLFSRQLLALVPLLWFYTFGRFFYSDGVVFVAKKG